MRVDEIRAAAVDVDRKSKVPVGHRRTFEMPSRAAPSEGTRPGRALRDAPPQSEVDRRAPARMVEARVILRRQNPPHLPWRVARELPETRERRNVVIQAARRLVGVPAATEALGELDHRRDLPGGVRHRIRFAPVEATHVPEKGAFLAPTELAPADLILRGALQDGLVDVRDVLGVPHALSAYLQEAREHVEDEERAGVG